MLFPPLYAMPVGIDVLVLREFLLKPVHSFKAYAIKKPAPKYSFETS
jgi:hypothetical protein